MQNSNPVRRLIQFGAVATLAILALAACSTAGATASHTSSSSAADTSSLLSQAYAGHTSKPPVAPVKVTPDQKVWIVSCGQAITTCSGPGNGALAAAKAIGWSASVCDGKLNPQDAGNCILEGIAAKANVIVTVGLDCPGVSGPLAQAKAAGILTVGVAAVDCDVSGGKPLFSAVGHNLASDTYTQWWTEIGTLQAKYILGKTHGAAKVLNLQFSDGYFGADIAKGFNAEIAKFPNSKVVATLQIGNADVGSGALVQKFSTALLQNPTANAIAVPIDGWFLAGLGQAIQSSGRASSLTVIGAIGSVPNYGLIRANTGEDATVAFSGVWDGWAGIDMALRLLAHQPALASGLGFQVVDASHGLPSDGKDFVYDPTINFQSDYLKAWGKN
jgi:ABC-type sugar transport system substrate-binding protein